MVLGIGKNSGQGQPKAGGGGGTSAQVRQSATRRGSVADLSSVGVPEISSKDLEILYAVAKFALPIIAIAGIAGAIVTGANPGFIVLACVNAGVCVDLFLIASWKHKQIVASKMDTAERAGNALLQGARHYLGRARDVISGEDRSQERAVNDAIEHTFFLKHIRKGVNWIVGSAKDLQEAASNE